MNILAIIFWFIVIIGVLTLVHELGHFIAARAFGVRVTEFMIGMPGPNIGFERNGCRYGVTCIPLGGYNRIAGMEGDVENPNLAKVLAYVYRHGTADVSHVALGCDLDAESAELALAILDGWGSIIAPKKHGPDDVYSAPARDGFELGQAREVDDPQALLDEERSRTYRALSFPKRLVTLFAGPFMNVLLAFVLLIVIFCGIGLTVASTTLGDVVEGSPAQEAGLQAGDTIVAIDGTDVPDWQTLSTVIAGLAPGEAIDVAYERNGQTTSTTLIVGMDENGSPRLGIYAGQEQYRLPVGQALTASWEYLVLTVQGYLSLFNPATAGETLSQSTSVVGIAVMSERAASAGIVPLLFIIAIVSLSLAVVNLLPLPPLDGGRILIEVIQRVTHRAVPARVVNVITFIVIALLLVLFVFLLRQDIVNFFLKG